MFHIGLLTHESCCSSVRLAPSFLPGCSSASQYNAPQILWPANSHRPPSSRRNYIAIPEPSHEYLHVSLLHRIVSPPSIKRMNPTQCLNHNRYYFQDLLRESLHTQSPVSFSAILVPVYQYAGLATQITTFNFSLSQIR